MQAAISGRADFDIASQPGLTLDRAAKRYAQASHEADTSVVAFMFDEAANYYRTAARKLSGVKVASLGSFLSTTDESGAQGGTYHPFQMVFDMESEVQTILDAAIAAMTGEDASMPTMLRLYEASQDWCADLAAHDTSGDQG